MRLKSLTAIDPGGNPLLDYQYTYDEVGNILTKATEHGNYSYDYDAMTRLISADNPVLNDETYTYDNVGNRLTSAEVTGNWNYNANNELLGFADVEYDYDENGNITQIKAAGQVVWTYVYDAANRLVHVEDGTGSISADYYYDPFGRRLWKDVGGTKTYFFYSEEGLIAEYDASGTEIRRYGYKPDSTWTTDPLFMKQGTEYYFYQNDHLGTPQKLVAMNGSVVWSAQYTAFGKADVQVETVTNNLRFSGQYYDAETGLHYNFHRYYDPKIGRYLQVDLIGFKGGDTNLYGYSGNNPVNALDNLGLYTATFVDDSFCTSLRRIPSIARARGWNELGELFDRWFSLPGGDREHTPPDTRIITMKWVLGFPRTKEAYNEIISYRLADDAAKRRILKTPKRIGIKAGSSAIGTPPPPRYSDPFRMLEFHRKHWIASASVGGNKAVGKDALSPDALFAALARFSLFAVITKGEKFGDPLEEACLRIDEIGIYVQDSFDFVDSEPSIWNPKSWMSQPLGFWNDLFNYGGPLPVGMYVDNDALRAYRDYTGMGGDFYIFSDVKFVKLVPPAWISFSPFWIFDSPGSDPHFEEW